VIEFFYGVQPWYGVELEHEGLSDALMGILVNFVLYFLPHSGCLEVASSLLTTAMFSLDEGKK